MGQCVSVLEKKEKTLISSRIIFPPFYKKHQEHKASPTNLLSLQSIIEMFGPHLREYFSF